MEQIAEFFASVFIFGIIVIGFLAIIMYPSQTSIEAVREQGKEVDRQGNLLLEQLKDSDWSLEDIANLPLTARKSFIEQLDLDYNVITDFIEAYYADDQHYAEVNHKVHSQWLPYPFVSEYRATRQALRQVSKNNVTKLPK